MKAEVTSILNNSIKKVYTKVISIVVSFFNFLEICIFDLFNDLYIGGIN